MQSVSFSSAMPPPRPAQSGRAAAFQSSGAGVSIAVSQPTFSGLAPRVRLDRLQATARGIYRMVNPHLNLKATSELTPEAIRTHAGKDVKELFFDLDGTLMRPLKGDFPQATLDMLHQLKKADYHISILSNNISEAYCEKAQKQLEKAGIKATWSIRNDKPNPQAYLRLMNQRRQQRNLSAEQLKAEHFLMVGDNRYTDIFGGGRVGMKTALVGWFPTHWWQRGIFGLALESIGKMLNARHIRKNGPHPIFCPYA